MRNKGRIPFALGSTVLGKTIRTALLMLWEYFSGAMRELEEERRS